MGTSGLFRIATTSAVAAALVLAAHVTDASARSRERSVIRGTLEQEVAGADDFGIIRSVLKQSRSKVRLSLKGLDPSTTYELRLDGVTETVFVANPRGRARILFQMPLKSSRALPLSFDPRGKVLTVSDGTTDVLSMVVSGPGEPADILVDERTRLQPTALAAGAEAEARFRISRDGRRTFKVEVEDMPLDGTYELRIDGILKASLDVVAGRGEVEFDSEASPPKLPLDFDPRGAVIDITQGMDVFFSGPLEAQADGVNTCAFTEDEVFLTPAAAPAGASARARLRTREDCDVDLRVEVDDVLEGDYAVCVDGVLRGIVTAAFTGSEVEGQIEFDTDPDPDELLLDFEVSLDTIEVRDDDGTSLPGDPCPATAVLFAGVLQGDPGAGICEPSETTVLLEGAPAAGGGSADARLRTQDDCDEDLRIEVQDVPEGSYDVCVGGTLRGTLQAAFTGSQVEGQIEWDTEPQGDELLLDFAVDLATIEIRAADPSALPGDPCPATTLFFGGGSGGPGPGPGPEVCELVEEEVPLLNVGPEPNAKGKARFRMDSDCDRDFRVEIEDLPAGDYELLVGGVSRGTITVAFNPETSEVEGRIDFDTDPDQPGEVPFPADMDPRGQEIEIVQGGTTFLARTFP